MSSGVIRRLIMRYDAFFISPEGKILAVPDRHIVRIIKDPNLFGLTLDHINAVYKKFNEDVGWEGYARNEIILNLLKIDWVRLRFFIRSGTWRLQIHEELNETLKNSILIFCQELKKGNVTNQMPRTSDPHIEIHDTKENIISNNSLDETIKFLPQPKLKPCH